MKKIYQGKTVWIVNGFGRNAIMKQIYVAKSFSRQTEELRLASDFIGATETTAQESVEAVEDRDGLSALMSMCRSYVGNIYTFSQSIKKIKVLHSFIEGRDGNQYDVSMQTTDEIFTSRIKAKRRFLYKPKASFFCIDEAHAFLTT